MLPDTGFLMAEEARRFVVACLSRRPVKVSLVVRNRARHWVKDLFHVAGATQGLGKVQRFEAGGAWSRKPWG